MTAAPAESRLTFALADEAATARLAEDIAAIIAPGDLVALSGGLGAGKTSFARALLRALAGDPDMEAPSPTFPIRIDHPLPRFKVVHADLYRLGDSGDLDEIGLEEALSEAAVLVEWPELLPERLARNRLNVALEIAGDGRVATVEGAGTWTARLAGTRAIRAFLDQAGWRGAARQPLAGDASSRAYERVLRVRPETHVPHPEEPRSGVSTERPERAGDALVLRDGPSGPPQDERYRAHSSISGQALRRSATAVLMNAPAREAGPPIHGGRSYDAVAHRALDAGPFIAIGLALRSAGVRAPEILATYAEAGLLLLEDLGGEGILDASGAPSLERYEAAVDVLVFMHGRAWLEDLKLPDGGSYRMPPYDRDALLVEISLFPDWFGAQSGEPAFPKDARDDFLAAWSEVLEKVKGGPTTWVMRDFHSPNILWRPDAHGLARVGVLDFQDALIGHPAYDVASLAQDARAPLSEAEEAGLKARYVAGRRTQDAGFDATEFETAYAVLAAQRATKVLGAFTRLALVEGKPGYQRHRDRLKALLRQNLAHPVLSDLRLWYEPYICE